MQQSFVNFLALGAAAFAAIAAIAAAKRGRSSLRSRSAPIFALSATIAFAGFALALVLDNSAIFAGSAAIALVVFALGAMALAGEAEVLDRVAGEQRVDHISGLPNERLFFERLTAEHSRTKRTHQRYSIAVFEIDEYGLLSEQDKTNGMKLLAGALEESIRNTDTLGRLGTNQAAVLLVDTLADGAAIGCDRACERFFFQSCGHSDHAHVTRPLTVSVGIASFDDDTVDPRHVVDNAQLALKRMRDELDTGIRVFHASDYVRPSVEPEDAENLA